MLCRASTRLSPRRRCTSYPSPTSPAMIGLVLRAGSVPDLFPCRCNSTGLSVPAIEPRNTFTAETTSPTAVELRTYPFVARLPTLNAGRYHRPRPDRVALAVRHVTITAVWRGSDWVAEPACEWVVVVFVVWCHALSIVLVDVSVRTVWVPYMGKNPAVANIAAIPADHEVSATDSVTVLVEYHLNDHGQAPSMVPAATCR